MTSVADNISVEQYSGQTQAPRPASTHEVLNQPPEFTGFNWFTEDTVLQEAVEREGAGWARDMLTAYGDTVDGEPQLWGDQANENTPVLRTHDRFGNRINQVEFHPDYHQLMTMSMEAGLASIPWRDPGPGAHVARAAIGTLSGQIDGGHLCPVSGTFAAIPAIRKTPSLAAQWEHKLTEPGYDYRNIAPQDKDAITCAMGMTEKQGGSDVRANTTVATPIGKGGSGEEYLITGHKSFFSAPMCDVSLFLAQAPEGLSCFLIPRRMPDGSMNNFRLIRLKDKLGNRSNASSEIEFDGAWGQMVGEPGRGVPAIIEMVNHTRLECLVGSATGMRLGVARATHHAAHRAAFGKTLIDQPLMQNVLADLCVESEAATILAMRMARTYDEAPNDPQASLLQRLGTAVSKYWICKRLPQHSFEVLEAHGGGGYIEESGIPRMYREAPLMSVWEGSGNVMCLDVLRALAKEPESLGAVFAEVEKAEGLDTRLDAHVARTKDHFANLTDMDEAQTRARRIVEDLALSLQGALVVQHADPVVREAYCATRLGDAGGSEYGTLPTGLDYTSVIERHRPTIDG